MEQICFNFLNSYSEFDAIELLQTCRYLNLNHLGMFLGKFLEKQFPYSINVKKEYAFSCYCCQQHEKAFNICQRILNMKGLNEKLVEEVIFNQKLSIHKICNRYIHYDREKVNKILNRTRTNFPLVTLTITSCKRFDLFEQTVNSFIASCTDLEKIDTWFCVDDNSSEEDRKKMKTLYPFFTFYFKTIREKGHPQSMNIIRNFVKTPYIFHLEDDWKFFVKKNFISEALEIMGQNKQIKQVLINKNYAETETDNITGGEFHTTLRGLRYFIHEFVNSDEKKVEWHNKYPNAKNHCNYWPHFSFRPSLIQTSIFKDLGEFNEKISHFEMEYSFKYFNYGYVSAFLEGFYSIHIGRLTSECMDDKKLNAYALNEEIQFFGKEEEINKIEESIITLKDFDIKMKTYVLNLDKRLDRWEKFKNKAIDLKNFNYERFSSIDGSKLKSTPQLQRIFDGNDYNMRVGLVGCAMSHIKLYIELLYSDYDVFCIFEDDIDFTPRFDKKLLHVYNQIKITDWDILLLGNHLYLQYITEDVYNKIKMPFIEKWDKITSLSKSVGGTGGYLISKKGAQKLLDIINKNGMSNGIDTVQQKFADELNIFYANPHLIYSECYRPEIGIKVDSDIQYNFDSLTVPVDIRLKEEIEYYGELNQITDFDRANQIVQTITETSKYYYKDENSENIYNLKQVSVHPCYTLENSVLIIVPGGDEKRYFERLSKNGRFNIDDAIVYKE